MFEVLRHPALAALLAALLVPDAVAAQSDVDGAAAPVDTWYTQGGCGSRSGIARTPPVVGELVPAWSFEAPGTIESEPLVWNQGVFLSSRDARGRAWLHWIDLDTGEVVARKDFKSEVPLEPSVWRNRLVLRSGPKKLSFFRIENGSLSKINDYRAKQELSAPLLFETEVFVVEGGSLVALKSGRSKATWKRAGRFHGRPSLYGDQLYVMQYEPSGEVHLLQLARESGEVRRKRIAAVYPDGIRGGLVGREPRVQIFDDLVVAHHASPVPSSAGQSFRAGYWSADMDQPALLDGLVPLVQASDKILAFVGGDAPGLQHLELLENGRRGNLLARPRSRPRLFETIVAPSLAGERVAYLGTLAIDVEDHEVLWKLDTGARFPLVPARNTVLVVPGEKTLVALRKRDLSRSASLVLARNTNVRRVTSPALVVRSGAVLAGELEIDWKARTLLCDEQTIPFADVLLLLGSDERALLATTDKALEQAVRTLGMARAAPAYAEIGRQGITTRDAVFLARIAAKARAMGAQDESLVSLEKRVEAWSNKPSKNVDHEAVARLEEREREVERLRAHTAYELYRGLDEQAPERLRLQLLRITLREAADHAEALEQVWKRVERAGGSVLAREREQPSAQRALGWIEYLLVAEAHPTHFHAPSKEKIGRTPEQRALGRATANWRKDIIGASSGDLRILTPLTDPEVLAQCLATGHLVTSQLDRMFAQQPRQGAASAEAVERADKDRRSPLTLYLYESKEEYQAQSARRGEGEESSSKYRAGHYSIADNLQHVYMPADRDARERVLRTYAHELTHNWAQMRCPLYEAKDVDPRNLRRGGYWIVEGFASFVQEFRYDFEAGVIDPFNPRAGCFDTLANARTLHDWKSFYDISGGDFATLNREPRHEVPLEWRMGRSANLSDANLFYAQAAATVQYLYHTEAGRYRDLLMQYMAAYYTGKDAELDIEKAIGLSPGELGERVIAFSREMLAQG